MRRALILVSKALQQLANGMSFGAKEEYMTILNPFLDLNFERVKNMFRQELVRSYPPALPPSLSLPLSLSLLQL